MQRIITLIIIILLSSRTFTIASHAVGGDITYRCIGHNQYEITFSFYRDCSGIPAPANMDIQFTNSCGYLMPAILAPTITSPTQISSVCPGSLTTCDGGILTGIEEWIYQGVFTLPGPCSDWNISHTENARNSAITTIAGAGSDNLHVYAILNNTDSICNNSPVFSNRPIALLCENMTTCLTAGTYDIEGDSLTYEFITPRTGPLISDTVSFLSGYTYSQPLVSSPPVTLNASSGTICMTPTELDVTPMAILISEFRDGVLIGQIERDMQLTVMTCSNNSPFLQGINGLHIDTIVVCVNQANCFFTTATDADPGNTTFIGWDLSIPTMNTTSTGGHRDTLIFCWTPVPGDVAGNPNCFSVTAYDDNCPYILSQTREYCLIVDSTITCSPLTVPDPVNQKASFKIYPQPAVGSLNIESTSLSNGSEYGLRITDLFGRTIHSVYGKNIFSNIDLSHITSSGIFILQIFNDQKEVVLSSKVVLMGFKKS